MIKCRICESPMDEIEDPPSIYRTCSKKTCMGFHRTDFPLVKASFSKMGSDKDKQVVHPLFVAYFESDVAFYEYAPVIAHAMGWAYRRIGKHPIELKRFP